MDSNHRTPKRTDLQSVAVGHLATCPLSHLPESNWRPTDYKSVALPAELRWQYPSSRRWILRLFPSILIRNGIAANKELPPKFGKAKVGENGFRKNFSQGFFPPQLPKDQALDQRPSGGLFFFLLFDQVEHGIQGRIKGFFEGFANGLNEQVPTRYMHPNLRHLILDRMDDVIQFQENRDLNDVIVLLIEFLQLFLYVVDEFAVGTEMHGLNGNGHKLYFSGLDRIEQQ